MSDINEEQKRQYKRAEENDIKLLQDRINKAIDKLNIQWFILPNNGVVNLEFNLKLIEEAIDILKGDD